MVKGLLEGMMTLVWAFLLLFIFIFMIGVAMVFVVKEMNTFGAHTDHYQELYPFFYSLEMSMLTVFRCLTGDCSTTEGLSLVMLLTKELGPFFVFMWVGVIMITNFGLYNLIMAIYIEKTLAAAKHQNESYQARTREALRLARNTRALLKRFCHAQRQVQCGAELSMFNLQTVLEDSSDRDLEDFDIQISRDTFLLVLQDPVVQNLMDIMEITTTGRENLFDAFDADGSKTLGLKELTQGFLKVRGEPQRSDSLAGSLGVRAILEILRRLESDAKELQGDMKRLGTVGVFEMDTGPKSVRNEEVERSIPRDGGRPNL